MTTGRINQVTVVYVFFFFSLLPSLSPHLSFFPLPFPREKKGGKEASGGEGGGKKKKGAASLQRAGVFVTSTVVGVFFFRDRREEGKARGPPPFSSLRPDFGCPPGQGPCEGRRGGMEGCAPSFRPLPSRGLPSRRAAKPPLLPFSPPPPKKRGGGMRRQREGVPVAQCAVD